VSLFPQLEAWLGVCKGLNNIPRSLYPKEINPADIQQETGSDPETVWRRFTAKKRSPLPLPGFKPRAVICIPVTTYEYTTCDIESRIVTAHDIAPHPEWKSYFRMQAMKIIEITNIEATSP
jgi:hypothetical protein